MSRFASKLTVAALVGVTLAATAGDAFAIRNQYTGRKASAPPRYDYGTPRYGYRRHRGIGPGLAAGAALGIAGAAIAGAATSNYYNGYRAYPYNGYGYGEGYNGGYGAYGYDYLPGRGYYGPY